MAVRVMLAFGNMLFAEGISRLLDGDKNISVIETFKPDAKCTAKELDSIAPDIILADFGTLYNSLPDLEKLRKKSRVILIDTNCGRDNLVTAILKKKLSGVLLGNSTAQQLKKAVQVVANGELWIDRNSFNDLLSGINALGNDKLSMMSGREKEVIALVGQGFRNKEIAGRLNISEPTVKAHLSRIFQKLNVRTRSELVSYAIKNNDMSNYISLNNRSGESNA